MSREEFIKIGLELVKKMTPELMQDWINLAISSDFSIYYSTIDRNSQKLSQQSFLELYKKGEAYLEDFPTIFCLSARLLLRRQSLRTRRRTLYLRR